MAQAFLLRACIIGMIGIAGCAPAEQIGAAPVFEDRPDPTPFTRAYSLSEHPGGNIRIFAQEDGDETDLFISRRSASAWSTPERIDLPHRQTLTSPSFDPADGTLYYSSDAEVPFLPGRKDLNIWRVPVQDGKFGEPGPLPESINTGANEISPAIDGDGTLYFATNHSRGGGGGYDIMIAEPTGDEDWQVSRMPDGTNDRRADAHLAITRDGQTLFFYSHRAPKAGSTDIWVLEKDASGQWGPPLNAGGVVNTEKIEFGAGLSADGKTFFFSREGRLMQVPLVRVIESSRKAASGVDGLDDG